MGEGKERFRVSGVYRKINKIPPTSVFSPHPAFFSLLSSLGSGRYQEEDFSFYCVGVESERKSEAEATVKGILCCLLWMLVTRESGAERDEVGVVTVTIT